MLPLARPDAPRNVEPGPCPCALLPVELLEAILAPQFDSDARASTDDAASQTPSQRKRIRVMTNYSLVCKAWKPVAERLAFGTLLLHLGDLPLCEYLDPVSGAGARLLQLARLIEIIALDSAKQHSPDTASDEEASSSDADDEAAASQADLRTADEPEGASSADAPAHETGEAAGHGGEPSSLELDRLSRVLDVLVHPSRLSCALRSQAVLSIILSAQRVQRTWLAVRTLTIVWAGRIRAILPQLASLSTLANLAVLEFVVGFSAEAREPAPSNPVVTLQPLRALESLSLICNSEPADELAPIALLLPTNTRMRKVKWAGSLPADFGANLPPGPPIETLFLAVPADTDDWIDSTYLSLKDLGHRSIDTLSILLPNWNLMTSSRSLKVGDLLDNVPSNVRVVFSVGDGDETAVQHLYGIDATLMKILQGPHAPKPAPAGRAGEGLDYSYRDKPLKQVAILSVNLAPISEATRSLAFARYGGDDENTFATAWMMIEPNDLNDGLFDDWIFRRSIP